MAQVLQIEAQIKIGEAKFFGVYTINLDSNLESAAAVVLHGAAVELMNNLIEDAKEKGAFQPPSLTSS